MLELNEENVNNIFNEVRRKFRTGKTYVIGPIRDGLSEVYMDTDLLHKNAKAFAEMVGQLKIVHDKDDYYSYSDVALLYNNLSWTTSKDMIDKFHYLLSSYTFGSYDRPLTGSNKCMFLSNLRPRTFVMRLSEKNVSRIMKAGFMADDSEPNSRKILGANGYPTIYFDQEVIVNTHRDVLNMFGQTAVIHAKAPKFDISDLVTLYDGSTWTNDTGSLRSLYYLLYANTAISRTERRGPTSFRATSFVKPTFFEGDEPKSESVT